ncbi:transmembrane protein [Pasteurella canis]|uniref:Transmembrane protein n=1 Tax=Pasteurella canis TaxID=753 RepID=A0A379EWP9_9PAST|nr:FAD/NAD(P)-binding oxidoreductase [Pasteurella canis]SPY34164.1 transmembrane protein [Pasteurella canis]SUC10786.1 transmembrane protein [Pasteurella canis]
MSQFDQINQSKRQFIRSGLAMGTFSAIGGTGLLLPSSVKANLPKISSSANIVIAGAGAAGLTIASRLAARLDPTAKITLIDSRIAHYYQPGFTLVAGGIKPENYVVSQTADYLPENVKWIQASVNEFDPDSNSLTTSTGEKITYDYLFVATGLKLDYDAIEGMDVNLIGKNGLGSVYHSPSSAYKTWQLLDEFANKGGDAVFLRPATEMKCAGAPLKYAFIVRDYLQRRGTLDKSKLLYNAHNKTLFSVPIVDAKLKMLFAEKNIHVDYNRVLTAIDPAKRIATFNSPEGKVDVNYDFINVVPPMRAPDAVRNSPLAWQEGGFAADGWVEVEKHNLRHRRYKNVFAVGDVAGVPKGKTAASVKWQVPVAVEHLLAELAGKPCDEVYNGYTSCPMITQLGKGMLIEFDYNNHLTPSFPGIIAPLEELWATWAIKTLGLKPTYLGMLRGLA